MMHRLTRCPALKSTFDLILLAAIIAAFLFVAAQNLAAVPLPDTDEAMTLQVPYEMLNRGKLAFPMYRYLGGNIENVWHSYTPVFFALLGGFQKLAGWGLAEGRAFNLIMAALLLVAVHLIGRRLFNWRVGLIAVLLIVSDPTFLDRSRLVRNDYIAAMFGLLAYYLYEMAERPKRAWLYFAAGVAAGAGVMCHTNLLYALVMIPVLMLAKDGWRVVKTRMPYLFGAGALAAMSYEIVYDLIDYNNFLLQNREDPLHFRVLGVWGWLANLKEEPQRYLDWFNGFLKVNAPLALLHLCLYLAIIAVAYLMVRLALSVKRGEVMADPRARVLVALLVVVSFFALVTQRKIIQYVIHIAPWLALATGILLDDSLGLIARLKGWRFKHARLAHAAAITLVAAAAAYWGYRLVRQNQVYLANVNDPNKASFEEIKSALRQAVPAELCPIAVKSGFLWLAFPEKDYCFAALERRMKDAVDIHGKDYALILRPKQARKERKLIEELTRDAHLIGELNSTAYGSFQIYYTGTDPRYIAVEPKRFYFFERERGHVTDEQLTAAREVWSADSSQLSQCAGATASAVGPEGFRVQQAALNDHPVNLCEIAVEPGMIYQLKLEIGPKSGRWQAVVMDALSGEEIFAGKISEKESVASFEDLFKSLRAVKIRLCLRRTGEVADDHITIKRASIREVARL